MRRTNSYYRTFTEAYRDHVSLHRHGWPSDALMRLWYGTVCSLKGGIYTDLKEGLPVPDKHAIWFVRLLVGSAPGVESLDTDPAERERLEVARRVTATFVAKFGIPELAPQYAEAILDHICYPRVPFTDGPGAYVDYLRYKISCFSDILFKGEYPDWVHGCAPKHYPEIVHWMYIRVAQEVVRDGSRLGPTQAKTAAARYMGIDEGDYCKQILLWSACNPWIAVRAWHRQVGAIGMSIALPVTDAAYRDIAEGRLTPYNCKSEHLQHTSLNIVLEAMAENPPYVGRSELNPTESLRACSVYQLAALARTNRLKKKQAQVRILGFAGTPQNEDRMRAAGFEVTPHILRHPNPKTKLKIFELTIDINQLISKNFLEAAALAHAGKHLPESPPLEDC